MQVLIKWRKRLARLRRFQQHAFYEQMMLLDVAGMYSEEPNNHDGY